MLYNEHLNKVKQELDNVSSSFCVAKWKQVTMHLQNGHTHSCHHPRTHFIPLEEIKRNPSALHNTEFKKSQRKLMLEGVRPNECDYCWRVEDAGEISDRVYKSGSKSWAYEYINEIANLPWNYDIDPSYVEVSFGNVCNFKCSYCAPHISSQWMEEIERFGPYPTTDRLNNLDWLKKNNQMPIPNNQDNPYVEAFWNWFPDMYKSLTHFRITGGEPLLNKNTFKVLDYIIDNPNPNLEVSINTNMNPPIELFNKFLDKISIIVDQKKIKKFMLFTSAEAHGKQCEYIRYGMNYDEWLSNIHKTFNKVPDIEFTIMSTYNLLSLTSYNKLLQDVLDIKRKYNNEKKRCPLMIDIPYLRFPTHQTIFLMEPEQLVYVKQHMDFMYSNLESPSEPYNGFFEFEADKLKRIYSLMENTLKDRDQTILDTDRKNFVTFVDTHDERRGTNFLETFPEFTTVYSKWKDLC